MTGANAKTPQMPSGIRIMVLAPHPDDPESVSVTCRMLMKQKCDIRYAIATSSPNGVEEAYVRQHMGPAAITPLTMRRRKIDIRKQEQIRSAIAFGINERKLIFLDLDEEDGAIDPGTGKSDNATENLLETFLPDIVMMPAGNDDNATHRQVHQTFRKAVKKRLAKGKRVPVGLYNRDPKTTDIRRDLYVVFGSETAKWKGELLRIHDSQQQRNLSRRDIGFDERILRLNRESFDEIAGIGLKDKTEPGYAEVFEIELFNDGREC